MPAKLKQLDEASSHSSLTSLATNKTHDVDNYHSQEMAASSKQTQHEDIQTDDNEYLNKNEEKEADHLDDQNIIQESVLNRTKKYIEQSKIYYNKMEAVFKHIFSLIKKDSFKFLRLSLSFIIIFFSLLFFLLTFLQDEDFFENLFNAIKSYVFVNNPTNNLRAN